MQPEKANELGKIANQQIELADKYALTREQAGQCECALELMVAERLDWFRAEKPNVGYDMAILMLIAENNEAKQVFEQWKKLTAIYKGLEKQIEARQSIISYEQSKMKYILQGEKYA